MGYFHVVYTLPAQLRDVAYQNKRVVYGLLMKAAAETTLEIAADPKRLGAKIGITCVLHTSCRRRAFSATGSAMTHHPHVHMIVPGGGLSLAPVASGQPKAQPKSDGKRWISSRESFLVHVDVLARKFQGKCWRCCSPSPRRSPTTSSAVRLPPPFPSPSALPASRHALAKRE